MQERETSRPPGGELDNDEAQPGAKSAQVENDNDRTLIPDLQARIADLEDRLLRALAEQENIRMRAHRDLNTAVNYASSGFAKDLLSTADNLRRALESVPKERASDETIRQLLTGVDATERVLLATLQRHGIRRVVPLGERYDPSRDEVVQEVPNSDKQAGTIVQVLQPGYFYHDRLLRPAMVNVARGESKEVASNRRSEGSKEQVE